MTLSQIVMFDAISIDQIPAGPKAVAGYVNGRWPTAAALAARFPGAHLLTIAVSADADAECLDIETGDARPADAPGWYKRQRERGVARPCLYASVSVMQDELIPVLRAAGIDRAAVRLWSAHYAGRHICGPGPSTCGELSIPADGCQWTDQAFGRSLDQSLLAGDFFAAAPAPVPAPSPPNWTETLMTELPDLTSGATGEDVRTLQACLLARRHEVTVDGDFGPATLTALEQFQTMAGLKADGICGPATWPKLLNR